MKTVLLTTDTLHHTYFVQKIMKVFPIAGVVVERKALTPPFETCHSFETTRNTYEQEKFFGGRNVSIAEMIQTFDVESANNSDALMFLKSIKPKIVVVFGTRKLSAEVIKICPNGIINLHGGDPEEYRGLDSHLWGIYHQDFDSLIITLHRLNEKLDDGEIILQSPVPIKQGMQIHELRRYNTEICIKLTLTALDMYARHGNMISRPQRKRGRYYSFMPTVLKEICVRRFKQYADTL